MGRLVGGDCMSDEWEGEVMISPCHRRHPRLGLETKIVSHCRVDAGMIVAKKMRSRSEQTSWEGEGVGLQSILMVQPTRVLGMGYACEERMIPWAPSS